MNGLQIVLAVVFFAVLGGAYALAYYLNRKTPRPAGGENLKPECKGCHDRSCMNNPDHHR
mgnify:FL=1